MAFGAAAIATVAVVALADVVALLVVLVGVELDADADVPGVGVPDVPDNRRVDRMDVAGIDCGVDIGIGGVPFPVAPFPDVPDAQNTDPNNKR